MKLVSVVVPTRNEEHALEKLLKSLKKQTYKNYELIVVDGGSTDDTAGVAKKYGAKVIKEYGKYKSPANARNIGVEKAKGDIIIVFDCDYEVDEKFLERGVKTFSSEETVGVICAHRLAEDTLVEKILASKIEAHPEIVHVYPAFTRKGFIQKMGGWDSLLGYGEDRELNKNMLEYNERKKHKALKTGGPAVTIHLPHTLKEVTAQQRWYGRTIFYYLKKSKNPREYLALLKLFYVLVPAAVLMTIFQADFWLPVVVISAPFILISLYRTVLALLRKKTAGLGIFFVDIIMGFAFAYGLLEYVFGKKQRGRD